MMYDQFDEIAFVTGDHLERFPFVGRVLQKLGAIVVDNCGGPEARKDLSDSFVRAAEEGRPVLIYPEGHLARVGEKHRYRSGVWHMQETCQWPVVPVATNLGLRWQCEDWEKTPGIAVIEFLDPIPPGLPKAEFLERLERVVEGHTTRLIAEGRVADESKRVKAAMA
jgi:1-acyl-sn-glycerol-3-phosphate acyltransferase